MATVVLSGRGRRRVLGGHPWIYADDVSEAQAQPGELVPVFDPNANPLGWGLYSSHSKICVRLVTRQAEQPKREFWKGRIERAWQYRASLGLGGPGGAARLLAGDADGVPGLVIDRYGDVLVLQSGCQGSDRMRDFVLELLGEVLPWKPRAILDRSDTSVRKLEDLEPRVEWIEGGPLESVEVEERNEGEPPLVYEVALLEGHKTGHYLDQRENRVRASRFAAGARVLDLFSYDGLFGVRAALAGAESVLCIDQSKVAGERLMRNAERNGVADRIEFRRANAMQEVRSLAAESEPFGLIVCDPPAFARNRREAEGAQRGYREVNMRALGALEPGGVLVSASCSYNVGRDTFLECLARAALDADREVRLMEFTGASKDHPVSLHLPESDYLKCAFLRA